MALGGGTPVASISTTNNLSTYRCPAGAATFTPTADAWLLVAFAWTGPAAGALSNSPTISDTLSALSWSAFLGRRDYNGGFNSCGLFVAKVGASPAAMAINVDFAGENQSGAAIAITQITGSAAAAIIGQLKAVELVGVGLEGGSATLDAALQAGSATFVIGTNDGNAPMTPRASWTEIDEVGYGTPSNRLQTQIRFSVSETTGSWTKAAGAVDGAVTIFELLETSGGTTFTKTVTGSLSFTGTVGRTKAFKRTLIGQLRLQGVVLRQVGKRLTAGLVFAGALTRRTSKGLTGVLSFTSTLGRLKSASKALAGVLSFTSALTLVKSAGKLLTGVLSFQGAVSRRIALQRTLGGSLAFAGTLSRRLALNRTLTGVLAFTSVLGRVKIPTGAVFLKTLTGILAFGPSTLTTEYHDNPEPEPGADSWLLRMRRRWGGK